MAKQKRPIIVEKDQYLLPFEHVILKRLKQAEDKEKELTGGKALSDFANGHLFYGLHKINNTWVYRDWLPNANDVYLIGNFSDWKPNEQFKLMRIDNGNFETTMPLDVLKHGDLYKLFVTWHGGAGERVPAYATRVVQDASTHIFTAQVWSPDEIYVPKYKNPKKKKSALIYEAHIGMSSQYGKVSTFNDFRINVLPRVVNAGYNTIQLMAIQEHPYYGSFGYHVSSFFAVSSRHGTPEELKMLIDEAHKHNIHIIMDIVHSHAVKNEVEGISKYDGTDYQFFHQGGRGMHPAWDSRCFDYGKNQVLHFLLSNCKYWIQEYGFDGFRFDGVTSMLYLHHGLGYDFMGYDSYFNDTQDEDAIVYLRLANKLIHQVKPSAMSVAEEMSGMPGLATPYELGGYGFDFRLAMGVPDFWVKLLKESKDELWHVGDMFWRLTDKREDESIVSYVESHDQALVGDKTLIFRLADKDMYENMHIHKINLVVERAIALHKMIRLVTATTAGEGYLNFMGNEFGHPEWIDFPREGNGWSHHYARRQWNLVDNKDLAYFYLNLFDKDFISLINKHSLLETSKAEPIVRDISKQILIYKRADLVFVFNFNPFNSFPNYGFEIEEGSYEVVLNSDSSKYLGQNRIDEQLVYKTQPEFNDDKQILFLYIPARTSFVLKKVK